VRPRRRPARTRKIVKARQALSGLDFFRKMIAGALPRPPMTSLLNIRLVEAEEGRVVFGAVPARAHYNGLGIVHGGLAAALLDRALGCAINTRAPAGKVFTTLEMKINFTRPLTRKVGPIRCEAKVVHMGNRVATAEGRVVDKHGKLYAHGTATCILFEPSRQARTT
jgi:uncharacterized protein (TIGR00369 family)